MAADVAEVGQCCGVPAPQNASPAAVAWNGMRDWYVSTMSPATASLAYSLLGHLQLLSLPKGEPVRVLETHCGDALAAASVLPMASIASYTAVDFCDGMVEKAEENLQGNASTMLADSTELPFESGSFDCYMSNLGCCCVSDFPKKLKEARRVLAPGGLAAMSFRIGDFEGDTSMRLLQSTLMPFGYPPGPDREGLRIGKDLQALGARMEEAGFSPPLAAYRSWVSIPVRNGDEFSDWATRQIPVKKFLDGLDDEKRQEALVALRRAGNDGPAKEGAMKMAVCIIVAAPA